MLSRIWNSRFAVLLGMAVSAFCISACSDDATSPGSSNEGSSVNSGSVKKDFHGSSPVPKIVPAGTYDCSVHKCLYDGFLNPDVTYGEFLDERDDHVYKTVEIGNRIWLAQNLVFNTASGRTFSMTNSNSFALIGGFHYTLAAAADSLRTGCGASLKDCDWDERGVCPLGFHMPTYQEASELKKILSTDENRDVFDKKNPTGFILGLSKSNEFLLVQSPQRDTGWVELWCGNFCSIWDLGVHTYDDAIRCVADTAPRPFVGGSYVSTIKTKPDTVTNLNRIASEYEVDWEYGELKDERDGKVYKTITIQGREWMAENLNYDSPVERGDFCYNDIPENCDIYGRYYPWAAAMDSVKTGCGDGVKCSPGDTVQGICPDGWRLPTYEDLHVFDENYEYQFYCAMYPEDEPYQKYHCNLYGFALPAIGQLVTPGVYSYWGLGMLMLSQEKNEGEAYAAVFTTYTRPYSRYIYKWQAVPVRCIKRI